MTVYSVTGVVVGRGKVQHIIKARNPGGAWERFTRAYSRFECVLIECRRAI